MKTLLKFTLVCLLFVVTSCRDTKQVEAETEAAVEQIETIEEETDEIIESVDENAEALKKELEELEELDNN